MTALLVKILWKQHETVLPPSMDEVLANEVNTQMQEARAWTYKLCRSENAISPKSYDAVRSPMLKLPTKKSMVVETNSKKRRFSLRRLFKHENYPHQNQQVAVFVPPVTIPTDFLTRERHGAVTVSGKRVPFTCDAHKRRKRTRKSLPCINEEHALVPGSSSQEAYRRRAYYPAKKKNKAKK
ncbi:unnamed protein product [Peronospora belbahrii]|uniref:Uncharacterized protein n=1 Tax=Peronospora belbahrii TaxID=622444 RepID=A0AAU9KK59_9STRA|nr:unnamed protein product [Peronospora belbahrii]CAH0514173.1 unnamed protein product [Peronospora belbahrii]